MHCKRVHVRLCVGCKRITAKEEIQSIHWATWTGVLGSEVNGIWPKYTQINDINATDTSFDHQTIVTGDDFGLVKLFRFPCIKKGMSYNSVYQQSLALGIDTVKRHFFMYMTNLCKFVKMDLLINFYCAS